MNEYFALMTSKRCNNIIALLHDSCLKVVFTRHSGFADSNLPQACLENLSETQNKVIDVTD